MEEWKQQLYQIANRTETSFDKLKLKFRQRMGWNINVQICPYMTFANQTDVFVKGRVLHDRGIEANDTHTVWENIANMYKRFASTEIAGAKLRIRLNDTTLDLVSDEDGYFEGSIKLLSSLPSEELWHHPIIELLDAPVEFRKPLRARARVMCCPSTAFYGVISDIDDTILTTHAQSLLRSAYTTFLQNAHSRLPFEGVAAFYEALQKGISGADGNPIFYVSSSPWNLYDMLVDFMKLNEIPRGPLFLKDYGFTHGKLFSEGHDVHKPRAIRKILEAYPSMKFILIGDSGQKDPEIYAKVVKDHPDRILAIYIRDVSVEERDVEVKKISESLTGLNVEMIFAENSYEAARHAAEKGFIDPDMLPLIQAEKRADEGKTGEEKD